jgi:response regulator RpfG family c-di-GMP phosphodiesterase
MARILIADTPQSAFSLKNILAGHELIVANTTEAAVAYLQKETLALVIVGIHFDDSQMFEFMRHVHTSPENDKTPIICFCARDTGMARVIHESIEVASKTAGAWMYLDAHSYNVYKEPEEELRRVIERCLIEGSRKEIQLKRLEIQKQRTELQRLRVMLKTQDWSPELEEYLKGLKHDLEVLLREVEVLQLSADTQRAKVATSRQMLDRVSVDVAMKENGLERTERIQHMDETRQAIQEQQIVGEEEERTRKRQRDNPPIDKKNP